MTQDIFMLSDGEVRVLVITVNSLDSSEIQVVELSCGIGKGVIVSTPAFERLVCMKSRQAMPMASCMLDHILFMYVEWS